MNLENNMATLQVLTNSLSWNGSDRILVRSGCQVIFKGSHIKPADLVNIINYTTLDGAELLEYNNEEMDVIEGDL